MFLMTFCIWLIVIAENERGGTLGPNKLGAEHDSNRANDKHLYRYGQQFRDFNHVRILPFLAALKL
jgi:hypothetical protein